MPLGHSHFSQIPTKTNTTSTSKKRVELDNFTPVLNLQLDSVKWRNVKETDPNEVLGGEGEWEHCKLTANISVLLLPLLS